MNKNDKEWLVRTRTGEILGPFTQHELVEEMQKRTFYPEDEIAPAFGQWVSAQGLSHHDVDEVTRTSTRSQTMSRPSTPLPHSAPISIEHEAEDLTPTPDFVKEPPKSNSAHRSPKFEDSVSGNHSIPEMRLSLRNWAPIVLAVVVVMGLWKFVGELKPSGFSDSASRTGSSHNADEGSPLVREVYAMIHAGKNQAALKRLTEVHERGGDNGNNDYLIPYAALLITEKESEPRARKILEQILDSPDSQPMMKARAHQWLGYLMLSQDEGDMGESQFLEALELNPKDAATRFNLGRAYLKQEKFAQALDYLQLSELEMPDLWLVHIYKGRARQSLGSADDARASFRAAIDKAPDRWMGYIYYSLFLLGSHQQEEAQAVLRRMITRDPYFELNTPPPFGFFQEPVNYSDYLAAYLRVMDKGASDIRELGKLYIGYLEHGSSGGEAKKLEAFADRGGLSAKVLALKVMLDRDAPTNELKAALVKLPVNLSGFGYYAYVLRGEALSRLGEVTSANQDFEKALLIEPKSAITHWALANLLKKSQRTSDAKSEIDHLLTYHPDYIPAIVTSQNF